MSWRDTALALGVIWLAEAGGLSEVEVAGKKELRARAVAVVEDGDGAVDCDIQSAAVAVLGNGAIALDNTGLAGNLGGY